MEKIIAFSLLENEESLKSYLIKAFGFSNSKIKKLAKTYSLSKNFLDKKLLAKDLLELPLSLLNEGQINPYYSGKPMTIIDNTEDWMAISKPSDCHTHPLNYSDQNNVLSFLRSEGIFEPLNVNIKNYDRGVLFRLDYETSGVILVSKKEELYNKIRNKYRSESHKKVYLAIVQGKYPEKTSLVHSLSTSGKKIKESSDGRRGSLETERLLYNESQQLSLVKIKLNEGMRHQIRVQLSLAGYPILGDEYYSGEKAKRLYLHATYYELSGLGISAQSKPDDFLEFFPDLDRCLDMLRN
jgi:23S rRNA-/tRNA-specific pseudouridylate synthase